MKNICPNCNGSDCYPDKNAGFWYCPDCKKFTFEIYNT